jgi:hypothetical protein
MTIRAEIESLAVAIDSVQPHPRNVRQGDVGAISISLEAHGQYKPILVQKSTGYIVAGNHTWQAAKALGWSEIAVQHLELDDDKAVRILLADNRSTDLASYDDHALAELLSEYARSYDMAGLLWNQDDLDDILRQQQFALTQQAFPNLTRMPTEGGVNPMEASGDAERPADNTRTASFFYTPEEFNELRDILQMTGIDNRNDALLKVAREWRSQQNDQ